MNHFSWPLRPGGRRCKGLPIRPCRPGAVLAVLALLAGCLPATAAAGDATWEHEPYRLGSGLHFPQQGLVVGGYFSFLYSNLKSQDWTADARDLSLFVSQNLSNRWQWFSEIELGDALNISADGITLRHAEVDLERLYADYRARPALNLRLGKYLTPVGRWNLIHADPLVWTADRPLSTAAAFARHATGAMLYGELAAGANNLDYKLYVDDSELLDPWQKKERAFEDVTTSPSPRNAFKRAVGAHIGYHFLNDAAQVGLSYARFKMDELPDTQQLFGADAMATLMHVELSSEGVYRKSLGSALHDEYGGFLQAAVPLPRHFYLIVRHEKYHAAEYPQTATIETVGITYRPHRAVSLKFEYRDGRNNAVMAPDGWLASLAVLF